MGGSGRGYFSSSYTPDDLAKRTRQAEDQARGDTFETGVGDHLASLLADFNDRDIDGTQEVCNQIKTDLENEIEGTTDTLFGGSIAKHTYVDGISDVDALVFLNNSELANKSPNEVKSFLAQLLRNRYGKDTVSEGVLAVTVSLQDKTIQLLPALRHGERVKIASSDGRNWSEVNPQGFANALTKANQRLSGKLVPSTKLIKAIVATLPEKRRITGYHTESMAINVFRGYDGPKTTKAMLRHFFEHASNHVTKPIKDSSGQSIHVDEYLGAENSLERRIVADALGRIGRKIRNADGARSLERWEELFE